MTDQEYLETQRQVFMITTMVSLMDLEGFLDRISKSHALGPIIDPTLYQHAMGNLQKIEILARELLSFQKKVWETACQWEEEK